MKTFFVASVALLGLAGSQASAADMAVKAPPPIVTTVFNWTGFYLGIEGGGAWGRTQYIAADPAVPAVLGLPITNPFDVSGGLFGGTVGYNWQFSNWVVGAEGDLSWVSKSGINNDIPPFTTTWTNTTSERWLGTGRLRLGVTPADRWLVYATGGFAVAGVEATVNSTATGAGIFSQTQTRWGWTVGGGIEAAINRNWSLKAEYLYVDLQNGTYFSPDILSAGQTIVTRTVTLNNNILRAGINYKFDSGPVVAKY